MIEDRLRTAGLPALPRLAWLEIDEDALAANLRTVRSLAGPNAKVAAVVKADGYGHGLVAAAEAFVGAGADRLCVATLDEALALRSAGIAAPILVLFAIPPDGAVDAARARIDLVVADRALGPAMLGRWADAVRAGAGGALEVHIEVDTGLTRGGIRPEHVAEEVARVTATPRTTLAALWSHLARGDDADASTAQAGRLDEALHVVAAAGIEPPPVHLAASAGLFAGTAPPFAMVRAGLCLYGELPEELPVAPQAASAAAALRPAMALKARPVRVEDVPIGTPVGYGGRWVAERPSRIATLPLGYADGVPRLSWPGAQALVRGRRVPLVGTVSMDAVAVDVTDVAAVTPDDEFVLLGAQGGERITATDMARWRTTIAWEVLASMSFRLPRVYHAASGVTGVRTLGTGIVVRGDPQGR